MPSQIESRSAPSEMLFGRLATPAQRLLPQRHKLLGNGGVHGHHCVDIGFGRLHLHRDPDELDHLAGLRSHDVAADDAVGGGIDYGRNEVLYTSTFASRSQACASVRPIAPTSGSENTAVGTSV